MPGYDFLVSFVVPAVELPDVDLSGWFEDPDAVTGDEHNVTFTLALTTCVSAEAGAWLADKFLEIAGIEDPSQGLTVDICS